MRPGAVIFDVGGVLVRMDEAPGQRAWEARLGLPRGELARIVNDPELTERAWRGLAPEIAIWQRAAARFGLNDAAMRRLEADFWRGEYLDERLVAFLREIRPRFKTGIISNAWSEARAAFEGKFGLHEEVDVMLISAEEGVTKPDPAIYLRACARLGVRPAEAIFVDDLAGNVRGAEAVGMKGIQFQSTEQVLAEIRAHLQET